MSCPTCGATLVDGARFCGQCGSPIAPAAPGGRRKTITVLFTDLVESTTMAERLDPEALSAVLARYFAVARAIVERHAGRVEKFIGDAVVAMFGVGELHEDDALRAVRTALELRDAVTGLNDDLERAFGVRLRIRTGVNTGEVVVDAGQSDSLAVGHAVSMAARLEQAAGPGEIIVGEETYRLVAASVEGAAIEPLAVKGSRAPVRAWRVERLAATPPPGWHGSGTYLGRTAELDRVRATYGQAVTDRQSTAALVVAPPGFGKTRFAAEAAAGAEPAARIVIGRAIADGGSTYGSIVDVLRQLGAGERTGLLETSLARLPDGPQVARATRALVDGTGVATTGEVAWVARRVLTAVASDGPLFVVLDDLHWADPLLLDVVAELVNPPLAAPVFVLALTRPELPEDRTDWIARMPDTPIVRLPPLSAEDTDRLVGERLGSDADLDRRRRIVEAAAGVPLFVEQWVALDAETSDETVPSSIRALMAARVDRISGDARATLETASIGGEAFTRTDLIGLAASADIDAALDSLVGREIIRRDPAVDAGYRFSHALLRDAVIDALPRRRRAELHERRATMLGAADQLADLELVGFHLEAAWRERTAIGLPDATTRALAARGAQALATVGRRSLARKEWHRAVDFLGRAERLLTDDPVRSDVLPDLVDALVQAHELEAADAMHREAERIARDPLDRARADTAWGRIHYLRRVESWPDVVLRIANTSIAVFEAAGDETWLARAHILRYLSLPSAVAEIETLKVARIHAERAGDERALIEVWDELGGAMLFGPTPYSEVLDFMRAEVAWARERGVAFTEADGMLGEAYALAGLGDVDAARGRIKTVRTLFAALPSVVEQLGESWMLEGSIVSDEDDQVAAADAFERAVAVFESCNEAGWARSARMSLAQAELALGRTAAAVELIDRIRPTSASVGWFQAMVTAADARVAFLNGDGGRARGLAIAGASFIDADTTDRNTIRALEALGDVLLAAGDVDAARRCYEDARLRAIAKEDRVAEPRLRAKIEPPR